MLAPGLNYEFLCYPLKTQYFDQLDKSLQTEVDFIFDSVEKGLLSNKDLKPFAISQMKNLFNLRMKAIGWFLEDNHIENLEETVDECYDDFDTLYHDPKMIFFVENMKFALRAHKNLVKSFFELTAKDEGVSALLENELKTSFQAITYDQFITSIALGVPDDDVAQKVIDLLGASLLIEFSAISGGVLIERQIDISEEKAIQLTSLIGNAAQEYSAISYEMGFISPHKSENSQMKFDMSFIEEQQNLADLGLNDLLD